MLQPAMQRGAALAIVVAIGLAVAAHACTSGSYNDPTGYITWRFLDLPTTYFNSMAFVPQRTRMELLPVGANQQYSSLGKKITTKYAFVCQTTTEDLLIAAMEVAEPGLRLHTDKYAGVCSDGVNTAGLHVSALMQPSSTGIRRYTGSGPAIEQLDIVNFILAQYADVDSILTDLANGNLNPVLNPSFEIITRLMFHTNFSALHYNIHDNSGRSILIEYSGSTFLQWYETTKYQGALANNPLWAQQTADYDAWFAANSDPYITFHGSQFLDLPGSFNSSHRFLRAAKLPEPGYGWEWPNFIDISPAWISPGQPSTNPAIMSAMDVFNSVYLPKGIDDAGGQQYSGGNKNRDMTWIAYICDHKYNTYYYRVANSPQWKRIALRDVNWGSMDNCVQYFKQTSGKWWVDESNKWDSPKTIADVRVPKVTLDQFKADLDAAKNYKLHP